MKRQPPDTESLVYAYGCGRPVAGLDHAEAEARKMRELWNRLVALDHAAEREQECACANDAPEAADLIEKIGAVTAQIAAATDKAALDQLHQQRRDLRRALVQIVRAWRKQHPETVKAIEERRRQAVVRARQDFTVASDAPLYWGNSNAVLQRYDTGRRVAQQFGRRLRLVDPATDDLCLTVQIQRTRTGLGAAPRELMDGSVAAIQIGRIDPAIYERRPRPRHYQVRLQMRVNAAGDTITLPVWIHRPLPDDCRVKAAQLVRRDDRWTLCLTISRPRVQRVHPGSHSVVVRIAPRIDLRHSVSHPQHPRQRIAVADIAGNDGYRSTLLLDEDWVREMERASHLRSVLDKAEAPVGLLAYWRRQLPGLVRGLLLRRREHYRLTARDLAQRYAWIIIESPALAVQAYTERGKAHNAVRHRACAHSLVAELKHQARKAGAVVEERIALPDASAVVPLRIAGKRINALRAAAHASGTALAHAGAQPHAA